MNPSLEKRVVVCNVGELNQAPPENVLLVADDADYVRACRQIAMAEASASACKIWVRAPSHFAWLRDFTEQIGCEATFQIQTPRLVLADLWNVRLPDWLTDADVIDQRLFEIQPVGSITKQDSFVNRLLVYLLGPPFQADALAKENMAELIAVLVSDAAEEAFERHPVLKRCLARKCAQWVDAAAEDWIQQISLKLAEDANDLWQWLSVWACLHGYPPRLLEYVLTPEQIRFVRKVPADSFSELPLSSPATEQALAQIEFLFHEVEDQVATSEDFQKVAGWTSGRLHQEFEQLSRILKSGSFAPTEADAQAVQDKFRSCPGVSEVRLRALRYCVAPDRPAMLAPESTWDSNQWLRWTAEEYTAYRAWQVHNRNYDEALEQTVARFSDWYVHEYAGIQKEPHLSLIHCLDSLADVESKDDLTIVLLVDCLPLAYFSLLDEALRSVAFRRHEMGYRFAALPTATAYNKPALVSGDWEDRGGGYETLLRERAQTHWNSKKVVYLSNLGELVDLPLPQEPAVILLNFVNGDELLHSDADAKGTTHAEELQRLFVRIAEAARRLAKQWNGPKERFAVHVVTDHGACRILEEERQAFDSTAVKKLFPDEKHRFAVVPDSQTSDVPDNLWDLGHRFKPPFVMASTTYFLPRGHHTVRSHGRLGGYLHGGVTPEEVIVPTAVYRLVQVDWKTPGYRFVNLELAPETGRSRFYIQRVVTLTIEVQNPNPVAIDVINARVTAPETDVKGFQAAKIQAAMASSLQISCYFKKSALGEGRLEIELEYNISGEERTLLLSLESEFKSAMSGGLNLRDL